MEVVRAGYKVGGGFGGLWWCFGDFGGFFRGFWGVFSRVLGGVFEGFGGFESFVVF